ncbi:hypothetical protein D3C83_262890 [compost metagenome]
MSWLLRLRPLMPLAMLILAWALCKCFLSVSPLSKYRAIESEKLLIISMMT